MVIHVDPDAAEGLPRLVPARPGGRHPRAGQQKINAAFNEARPQRVIDTLQANFDIQIHHYLEVDFESFKGIVDAMGGVPVFSMRRRETRRAASSSSRSTSSPAATRSTGRRSVRALARLRGVHRRRVGDTDADAPRPPPHRAPAAFMRRLAAEASKVDEQPATAHDIADETIAELKADEGLSSGDSRSSSRRSGTSTRTTRTASRW